VSLLLTILLNSAGLFQLSVMAVDWALYEKDVIRLYVNESKTINETLEYLHEKYGIKIRQADYLRGQTAIWNLLGTDN
jgi:hypothetical protein